MKVLVALHDYLPRHTGGSEIHAHQTAAELARRGHEVTAVFTERDLEAEEGTVRRGELDGVRTIEVVHQREYADVRESWEQAPARERFRRVLDELRPEVVHFHHLSAFGSGAVREARATGARVVMTMHDYHLLCDAATLLRPDRELCLEGPRGGCGECLRRHPFSPAVWGGAAGRGGEEQEAALIAAARERLARHRRDFAEVHHVVAPSRFLADTFAAAGFRPVEPVTVLEYGYPGEVRPPRTRDAARPLRVGYVGGIYPSKGVHVLVEAFRALAGAPVELDVFGHLDWFPEYSAALRREAEGFLVRFRGPFAPERLDEVMAGFDVLVVPSIWYENMPLTIQEAFRNGLPVVTTDLGGMAEAVTDGRDGLLFPRGDAAALADRLRSLAEDADLYDRLARGRPAVLSLAEVVLRLEAIYAA